MHFGTKSYLKNTRNHTAKHALSLGVEARPYDDVRMHTQQEHEIKFFGCRAQAITLMSKRLF
jgi:hypothetical protein